MSSDRITEIDVTEINEEISTEHSEVNVEGLDEIKQNAGGGDKPKTRVPRRVLHFSDGVIEEYSTDEDQDEPDVIKKQTVCDVMAVDPKSMTWAPWFWYQSSVVGTKTLEVCDYLGESLAKFFGITTPKYQYEMDFYNTMKAEEDEQKKQQDLEMGGWVDAERIADSKTENTNEPSPVISRY